MAEYGGKSTPDNIMVSDTKLTGGDDDKCILYESSTDSGFISSNLILSEVLSSEEIKSPLDSGVIEDFKTENHPDDFMRSDSGVDVCLSRSFTSLSVTSPGLNNLNSSTKDRKTFNYPIVPETETTTKKDDPTTITSWEVFYQQDEDGDTQLHLAILSSFLEVVVSLIRGAPHPRFLDILNDDGQTPLHIAVAMGQWRIVRWLVVAGARPCIRNRRGDTALHIAARTGDLQCCRAIMDPVHQQERASLSLSYPPQMYPPIDLDQWNYNGQTCIHVAAIEGHVNVLRHLVWYGADINARDMTSGYTALHYAVEFGDEKLIQFLLLECKKLNVQMLTYQGYSAIDVASSIPANVAKDLRSRGVPSPCSSDSEFDDDSDTEVQYETSNIFKPNLVINASA